MKKLILLLLALLGALTAHAQYRDSEDLFERLQWDDEKLHILLDTRFDFMYTTNPTQMRFNGQQLRLWVEGEIVPGIRYRFRHRMNRSQEPLWDGLAKATDNMYISFDIGKRKNWNITVGKMGLALGTYEFDYNGADLYLSSYVNNTMDYYKIGVSATYKFAGQSLTAHLFSPGAGQFATPEYQNKAIGGSLLYVGKFWNGVLNTRTAYTFMQHDATQMYSWLTTGWQVNAGRFTSELDCWLGDYNVDLMSDATTDLQRARDLSLSLLVRYSWEKWHPSLKAIFDHRWRGEGMSRFGLSAAVEFYPFKGHKWIDGLRFHAACTLLGWSDRRGDLMGLDGQPQILAGMRWFFIAK